MKSAYLLRQDVEDANLEKVKKILEHYKSASIATAGIYLTKYSDRKALQKVGKLGSAEENYYYRRIKRLVGEQIYGKLIDVGAIMLRHPDKAIYWGPYLMKICNEVKELCIMFQTVVTNNKLKFDDVAFLVINEDLQKIFDLLKMGDTDWKTMLDQIGQLDEVLTKQDLMEDLSQLLDAGTAIASASSSVLDSVWMASSKVGKIFHSKPKQIVKMFKEFKGLYKTFSSEEGVKKLLLDKIGNSGACVDSLFTLSGYNVSNHLSDYVKEFVGEYYRQRWYIYRGGSGTREICEYYPSEDSESIYSGGEWNRISTDNQYYQPTARDIEIALRNSENFAGWSRQMCEAENKKGGKERYVFKNELRKVVLKDRSQTSNRKTIGIALAHNIWVFSEWSDYEEVYEDFFDSQYNSEGAFQAYFQMRLDTLNDNSVGKKYYIGKGEKKYYTVPDEGKMNGCSSVSFTMECKDGSTLGEGNFSWKENGDQKNALDEKSKEYAMKTTLVEPDYSKLDTLVSHWGSEVTRLTQEIKDLEYRRDEIDLNIGKVSVAESEALRKERNEISKKISALETELKNAKYQLNQYNNARQEMEDDYGDEKDGKYRIPSVMHDLETAFQIQWSDEGSWSGWSFIRRGNVPHIKGEVVFKADLKKERSEKHLPIVGRVHRAILGVHWTLTANYSTSEVIDYMDLDRNLSDKEKADKVNARLKELMDEHPTCTIEINYAYIQPQETDPDLDAPHLLWASDRLTIAREVDYRLSKIYHELVQVEKYMNRTESLRSMLLQVLGLNMLDKAIHRALANRSFRRWYATAIAVNTGSSITDVLLSLENSQQEGQSMSGE